MASSIWGEWVTEQGFQRRLVAIWTTVCIVGGMLSLAGLTATAATAQVEAAFDAGEAWLLGEQTVEGGFGGLPELRARDTSATVLALSDRPASQAALDQAIAYLTSVTERNLEFHSLRAMAVAAHGDSPTVLLASIEEFRNGGGMGAFGGHQSSLLDTAFAIQALSLEESTYQLDIVELLDYLQTHQGADGGWGFTVSDPSQAYFSAESLQALSDLEQLAVGTSVLDDVASFLTSLQGPDGSFGSLLETAVVYRALLALGRSAADFPSGSPLPYLLAAQGADGSWDGDVFTTAQVLRVLRAQAPNLTFTAVQLEPSSVLPGTLSELTMTVRNVGPQDAGAGHLSVRRDAVDGPLLHDIELPPLAAGESTTLTVAIDTSNFNAAVELHVLADSRDAVEESSEDDNHDLVRLTVRNGPDLALFAGDLSVDPARPVPDQDFQLLINMRNLGESAVDSFAWRVSRQVAGAPTDVLAAGTAGPIGPGAALLQPVTLNLPEGEHSLEVHLDPDGLVDEENTENNLSSLSFFVVDPSQADLAVLDADLTLTPSQPAVGDSVTADITVRNLGQRTASSELVIYENDPSDGGMELQRLPFTADGGGAVALQATLTVGPTAHSYTFAVDVDGAVAELDEANNVVQRYFRQLPDLSLGYDNIDLLPTAPLAGDLVAVTLTVRNGGTAAASNVSVELYDGEPGAGGVLVDSATLTAVAPGGNRAVNFQWSATGGRNALVAVVDGDDTILELSESNNQARRSVAVPRGSGPDLRVTAVDTASLNEDAVTLAVDGSVTLTLANDGDAGVTEALQVRLFSDLNGNGLADAEDPVLGSTVFDAGLAVGATATVGVAVSGSVPFHRALTWAEVDAGDVVAEQREDNNLATVFTDCTLTSPPGASTEPQLQWSQPGLNVQTVPLVAQLSDDNGDGLIDSRDVADIVVQASDSEGNGIFARSGLDGSALWTFRSSAANPLVNHLAQAALADLDGDGKVEIVGHQTNGRLVALQHDGRLKWVSDPVPGVGGRGLGGPAIGDLDGDGVPEIALGRAVVSADGTLLAVGTGNAGENWNYYGPFGVVKVPGTHSYPQSVIADVDLDGRNELVAGDTLYRFEAGSLSILWNNTVASNLMRDGWNAVGNLDGDPFAEIVYVSSGQIMVLNHDGSTHAGRRTLVGFIPFQTPTFWGGAPSIADLDGDGAAEILVSTATQLIAYRGNLSPLWRKPIPDDFGGITGVTAFDLDGDGVMEVLFNGERDLLVIDGRNGATLHSRLNLSFTAMEHPSVADVDGDGRAEIILPSSRDRFGSTATQGLHVLGNPSWQGARPMWNQYGYHVTNVGLDGTVPSPQTPPWQLHNGFRGNLGRPAPQAYLPNLTVSLPRLSEATDAGVPVLLRVGNGGREPLPAGIRVELYDMPPGNGPAVGSAVTSRGLRPGQFVDLEVLWQGAGDGDVTAYAMVDPVGAVAECDETDNTLAFPLTATVLPDLAVTAGGVTATSPSPTGSLVAVQVVVENRGIAAAPATLVRLMDGDPVTGAPLADVTVEPLAAGERRTVEALWSTLGRAAGLYNLYAVLDPDGVVLESDETNNTGLTQVELLQATAADLDAVDLTVTPDTVTAGGAVRLTAEVLNRGATLEGGFEAGFFINQGEVGRVASAASLETGEARRLSFDLDTGALSGVLALEVRWDPDNGVPEADESNNRAASTLTVEPSPLALRLNSDRRSYNADEDVRITAVASNAAADTLNAVLSVDIVDVAGVTVSRAFEGAVQLSPGETPLDVVWNTAASFAGPYTAVGLLRLDDGVGNDAGVSASVLFSIAGEVQAGATLFADRDDYTPQQAVVLDGAVSNLGSNQALVQLTARIAVEGPLDGDGNGPQAFAVDLPLTQLLPGASRPLTALWEIANSAGGTYRASLELLDQGGLMIAYADTTLRVEDSATTGSGLRGGLEVSPRVVGAGAPLLADFEVVNEGNADMDELQLRIDMRRLADGDRVASFSRSRPLSQGQVAQGAFGLPTSGLPEEDYLVTLVGVLPGSERRLDSQAVTVAPGVSIDDATLLEGDGGTSDAEFAVRLSSPSATTVTVDFATADGTATAGEDYLAASGTLTFAPGETLKALAITVFGDVLAEPSETFLVTLSNAVGVQLGDSQGLGTLIDEEGCSGPNVLANGDGEGDSIAPWTDSSADGLGWSRRFADPAPLAGVGYFAYGGGAATAELRQTVDLTPYAEAVDGGGQTFTFAGYVHSGPVDGASSPPVDEARIVVEYLDSGEQPLATFDSGYVTSPGAWQAVSDRRQVPVGTRHARLRLMVREVTDPDTLNAYFDQLELRSLGVPVVTVPAVQRQEGDGAAALADVQLFLSCPAPSALTVGFATVDLPATDPQAPVGSAEAGLDYLAASGTATFGVGETTTTLQLEVIPDLVDERDELLEVHFDSDDLVVWTPRTTVTLLDDDGPVSVGADAVSVDEGASAQVIWRLSSVSGRQVEVSWSTADGSALADADYQTAAGTVVFPPGSLEQTVTLATVDDGTFEPDETFTVDLSAPIHATLAQSEVTVTVLDDDPVVLSVADAPRLDEGDSGTVDAVFTVSLSVPSVVPVTVDYATLDAPAGSEPATAGVDYQPVSGTLTLAPGATSATVNVAVIGDLEREGEELFLMRLSNPTVGSLGDPEAIGRIFDNDGILISVGDRLVVEGDTSQQVTVPVSLSKAATFPVAVTYRTVDGTAHEGSDYVAAAGTLDFPPGTTVLDVSLDVMGDVLGEPLESFFVELSDPVEALVLDGQGEVTILDTEVWSVVGQGSIFEAPVGCVRLTPDFGGQAGAGWRIDPINLTDNFDKTFRVYFGTRDNGSDGVVFMLQDQGLDAIGGYGGALGAYEIPSAFGVEVDTYDNGAYDLTEDHIAFSEDGKYFESLLPPVQASPTSANVEDGREHLMRVIWNAQARQVDVHFEGEHRAFIDRDLLSHHFTGNDDVFYGFTGGNGYPNEHYFCEEQLCADGAAPRLSVGNGYVTEGDGGGTTTLSIPVTLSCPAAETVTVDYATADATAVAGSDYVAAAGTLSFAPGETSAWVDVTVYADELPEFDESFHVALSNVQSGSLDDVELWYSEGVGNIFSDDEVWHLNGTADDTTIPGCVQLTPDVLRVKGSAWRTTPIDLNENFDQTHRVYFGTKDSNGALGMVFALQNSGPDAIGTGTGDGTAFGYIGLQPSIGVEMDTWDGGGSIDHVAVNENGSVAHNGHPKVQANVADSNIEDGQEHLLRVVRSAESGTLTAYFDGEPRLFYTKDIVDEIFGGQSTVFYGFTGGTGGYGNLHYFCETQQCFGSSSMPSVSVGDVRRLEGDDGVTLFHFPVTLSCPSEQLVEVSFATVEGDAVAGGDFAPQAGTFQFLPGETSKTVTVQVVADTVPEPTEAFAVQLTQPVGASLRYDRAVGTIESDDIVVGFDRSDVVEGDGGLLTWTFEVQLSDPVPTATTLQFATVDDTALAGLDYVAASGTVTFAAGTQRATLNLQVVADNVAEDDERLFIDFTAPPGSRVADRRVTVTIEDDDVCPGPNLLSNPSAETPPTSDGWTMLSGDWSHAQRRGALDGEWYFWSGEVAAGELLQEVDISSFAPRIDRGLQRFVFEGSTRTDQEQVSDTGRMIVEYRDAAGESLAVFDTGEVASTATWQRFSDLRLAPPGSRTIRVRLLTRRNWGTNNDGTFDNLSLRPLEWPTFSVVDAAVTEGESGQRDATLLVQQSCVSAVPTTVDYLTADGTASAPSDYVAKAGSLTLAPGETSATIEVSVLGDTLSEDDEVFYLDLVNARNAGVGVGRGTVTILQDEVLLMPGSVTLDEGNDGTTDAVFTLTLSAPSTLPISVDYYTGGGDATSNMAATDGVDYVSTIGTVTFAPGETLKTVAVQVLGDREVESDEVFRLNLDNPINVTLSDTRGYGQIIDDDVEVSIGDVNVQEGNGGSVPAVFPITLSKAVSRSVTVQWTTAEGLATAGVDFEAAAGSVIFQPGEILQEVRINVLGDTEMENSETFSVLLTSSDVAALADDEGIGTIIEDDDCPGPNLLHNGGFELTENLEIVGWTEAVGPYWQQSTGGGGRQPLEGDAFLFAGPFADAELRQDVDLTAFAAFIDAGRQRFSFEGFVANGAGDDDPARIQVDYLDAAGSLLDRFDSGDIVDPFGWRQVADMRLVPVGTRSAAVRLLSRRIGEPNNSNADAYFDRMSLRSVGTPVLRVDDLNVLEGDTASVSADFRLQLTCAGEQTMQVDYQTVDGTATVADQDYVAAQGTVSFAVGESDHTLAVEVVGDFKNELRETFTVEFSNAVEMVVLDRRAEAAIRDADPGAAPVPGVFAVYTLDHEFDTGSLISVHHDAPGSDQLQLEENGSTFPFIWVALSDFGTIVKIDVETGDVLGEYSTSPDNLLSDPSRTTVALDGSVWVGNRQGQTVAHIGLPELNQCVDRNGNGFIETSVGLGDVLPWPNADGTDTDGGVVTAEDECILHFVGVSSPGPRHLSVTKDNNIWVSGTGEVNFDLIDGTTGTILRTERDFACGGYGGLVDGNGIIWSVTAVGMVLRWDPDVIPATAESKRCISGLEPYGIAIDSDGWIWISTLHRDRVRKISPDGNTILGPFSRGSNNAQGLAVDSNDDVWISSSLLSGVNSIGHLKNDGTWVGRVPNTCVGSTGIAVDSNGKIWAACFTDGTAVRIDPTAGPIGADGMTPIGEVDLVVDLAGSEPYNYSDMTGAVALRATAPQGSFSAVQDSGIDGAEWGNVSWNTEPEAFVPEGGSITVEVRASDTVPGLGGTPWITIESAVSFEIYGRYLQVRATLRPSPEGVSPVLSDLRIGVIDDANVTLGDAVIDEGDPGDGVQAVFPVTFSESTVLDTTFNYTTVDGTAVAGEDYVAADGTVVIAAGQTTADIVIDILSDEIQEDDASFTVVLSEPQNAVFVDGEAVGTIVDDDVPALTITKTDTLSLDVAADGDVSPGDQVTYDVVVSNVGTAIVTAVTLNDTLPANATLVAASVTTTGGTVDGEDPIAVSLGDLLPGEGATVRFTVQVDDPFPTDVDELVNQATVTGAETGTQPSDDPATATVDDATRTPVVGLPLLTASKTDSLLLDGDGDGVVSPGDTLRYTLTLRNVGDGSASGVVLEDVVPAHTTVVPGSVAGDVGSVDGEDPVTVTLGLLAAGQTATVTFDVVIDLPLPAGVEEVVNQASLASDQLDTVLSDDPEVAGEADPTVTPVITTVILEATKVATLTDDVDADGVVHPGDELTYDIVVSSNGNTGATAVVLSDLVPDFTVPVAGSVTATRDGTPVGSVLSEDPVEVDLGTLPADQQVTVSFKVRIADPFPADLDFVFNQALIASAELDDVLSDDPATEAVDDPTVTPVVIPGQTTICELLPFDPTAGVDWSLSLLGDADQGNVALVDDRLHLTGDGTSLYHGLDNGAFYHHPIGSDADYRLEVSVTDFPVDTGGQVRKAALMLRTGLDPLAARVMVTYVPHLPGGHPGDPETTGLQFDARLSDGGGAVEIGNTVFGVPSNTRLAIEKKGDVATVYYSIDDGATWVQGVDATYGGSATIDWGAAGETVLAGVMVASYDASVPATAEFSAFETCRPQPDPPFDPPTPPTCDGNQPLDVIVLMDVSGSMTASFPGTGTKLDAAKLAFDRLVTELSSAPAGTRLGLVTAAGFRTPQENLAGAYTILSPLTTDLASVNALAQGIDGSLIEPGVPTPTALALKGVIDGALPQFDDANQPVLVWLSDGIANIDIDGRGPEPYELSEVQAISLDDGHGGFLSWGEVGWSGDFNPSIGTFDGEPVANAMFQLERLQRRQPELMIYGVALHGDGVDLGTFNPGLLEYGAYISGGRAFTADDTTSLLAAIVATSDDARCEMGTASLGGRLWYDRDGDGGASIDTGESGEPGLPSVTVNLFDEDGFGVTSTQTDGSGSYVFGQLPAGGYTVQVEASTLPTGDNGLAIDVPTYDLDGIDTVDTVTTTVASDDVRGDVAFGYRERDPAPPAQLCGIDTFDDDVLDPLWQWVEIGDADQGAVAEAGGSLLLTSDGTSLFHGTDNGTMVYRPADGDFRARVRVTGVPVDEGGPVRKGCLMVRSGSGDLDPRVMACYIPHLPNASMQAIQFDVRREDGTAEEMADLATNTGIPVELAIVREGSVLRVEYSLDGGVTWVQPSGLLGGEVTLDLGASPLLGVMVASYDSEVTTTIAFDDFEVCRPNPEAP